MKLYTKTALVLSSLALSSKVSAVTIATRPDNTELANQFITWNKEHAIICWLCWVVLSALVYAVSKEVTKRKHLFLGMLISAIAVGQFTVATCVYALKYDQVAHAPKVFVLQYLQANHLK